MPSITYLPGDFGPWGPYIGVTLIDLVQCWGGGQAGEDGGLVTAGVGGAGGGYAEYANLTVPENTAKNVIPAAGGSSSLQAGADAYFDAGSDVLAKGGGSSSTSIGTTTRAGGPSGVAGIANGGGGGGGAGSTQGGQGGFNGDGGNSAGGSGGVGNMGGGAGAGGPANTNGGNGGQIGAGGGGGGGSSGTAAGNGGIIGGAGGGSGLLDDFFGVGGRGQVIITWTWPTPDPTGISPISGPAEGPTAGGTAVVITGTPGTFSSGCQVYFDGTLADTIVVVDNATITCDTPAHTAGLVDVVVTNAASVSGTLADAWTYIAPIPSYVSPAGGTTAGGTSVTIHLGTVLAGGTYTVTFGGAFATSVVATNSATITCTTPAHAAGLVSVVVSDGTDSGTLSNGFAYFSSGGGGAVLSRVQTGY